MNTIWIPDLSQLQGPKYRVLTDALRVDITSGALPPGTRLPTVRELAWRLSVTPGTVARAYQAATTEGLLQATVGRGTFVAERTESLPPLRSSPSVGLIDPLFGAEPLARPDLLDMRSPPAAGWPDSSICIGITEGWFSYRVRLADLNQSGPRGTPARCCLQLAV